MRFLSNLFGGNDETEYVAVEWGTQEDMDSVENFPRSAMTDTDYDNTAAAFERLEAQGINYKIGKDLSLEWYGQSSNDEPEESSGGGWLSRLFG